MHKNSLLLELPLPFKKVGVDYFVEMQALNGLKKWAENFDYITVCAPVITDMQEDSSIVWEPLEPLIRDNIIHFVPLPIGYSISDYIKHAKYVKDLFFKLIPEHQYLCFGNVGTIGAWGNIASDIAFKSQRKYSLWFDWVIHEMYTPQINHGLRKLKTIFDHYYSKYKTLQAIKRSHLGLFHGKTVFNAYKPYSINPQLVHDIHIAKSDVISEVDINQKLNKIHNVIHVGYLGRVHTMKAPFDWIEIAKKVTNTLGIENVNFSWWGDGPLLEEARERVRQCGLEKNISFIGFESDRKKILDYLRSLDIFLFCHVTPESPRCLIEALISGTPIVGYKSAYAEDLVEQKGGGVFFDIGDMKSVAEYIIDIYNKPENLKELIAAASRNTDLYNDTAVFEHRSHLIKHYL